LWIELHRHTHTGGLSGRVASVFRVFEHDGAEYRYGAVVSERSERAMSQYVSRTREPSVSEE
jgi:hypothetical protein